MSSTPIPAPARAHDPPGVAPAAGSGSREGGRIGAQRRARVGDAGSPVADETTVIGAREALERLRAGNRRFASDARDRGAAASPARRRELLAGQAPFAIVLGCADSRVPVEILFDQGLGDLFVVRVAGNVAAPSQLGSIELAAERFGTGLVVVLGHSMCGAVLATLEALERPPGELSPNLGSIVERIRPSVEPLLATTALRHDPDALMRQAVRANIRASVSALRRGSPILERLVQADRLLVVGAEYSLESGVVDFFDAVPETDPASRRARRHPP